MTTSDYGSGQENTTVGAHVPHGGEANGAHTRTSVPPRLLPQHRLLIERSAISDTIRVQRGYYSETVPAELVKLGFNPQQADHVPAMVNPLYDVSGGRRTYSIRPDQPRV